MTPKRSVRALALAALAVVGEGCGGGSSGPTTPPSGAPTITNLVATFLAQSCSTPSSQPGTTLSMTVSYSDPEGDVSGGRLTTNAAFEPSTQVGTLTFLVPGDTASTTGTTAGTIQVLPCLRFGSDTGVTMSVTLLDATGAVSNTLTAQPPKPDGAP
jgi:hypothetical protein